MDQKFYDQGFVKAFNDTIVQCGCGLQNVLNKTFADVQVNEKILQKFVNHLNDKFLTTFSINKNWENFQQVYDDFSKIV